MKILFDSDQSIIGFEVDANLYCEFLHRILQHNNIVKLDADRIRLVFKRPLLEKVE